MITTQFLTDLVKAQNDPIAIRLLLDGFSLSLADLEKIKPAPQSNFPYSRKILHSDQQVEIMLATWTEKKVCIPHDHGASHGWVFYLRGNFQEQRYDWVNGSLQPTGSEEHTENSHAQVNNDGIHSCMAHTSGLTLHLYFPKIESMKVYDLENQRTLVVADDCGAWIPSVHDIKEEIKWKTN